MPLGDRLGDTEKFYVRDLLHITYVPSHLRICLAAGLSHVADVADADDVAAADDSSDNRWATAPCSESMTVWRSGSREVHLYAFAGDASCHSHVILQACIALPVPKD